MDGTRILKWLIVLALIFAAWKYGLPLLQNKPAASAEKPCVASADRASDLWGSGIGRFANPPYDVDAWSSFKSDVDSSISAADSACADGSQSSNKARDAMNDLRSLVNDCDSAIRSGAPPSTDLVQRQGQVDAQLDAARELLSSGK